MSNHSSLGSSMSPKKSSVKKESFRKDFKRQGSIRRESFRTNEVLELSSLKPPETKVDYKIHFGSTKYKLPALKDKDQLKMQEENLNDIFNKNKESSPNALIRKRKKPEFVQTTSE